jgi:hypothetical protein
LDLKKTLKFLQLSKVTFYFSNYNHSGNFKQHLLKHERESGSISAMLVAKAKEIGVTNLHDVNLVQSTSTSSQQRHASKGGQVERDPSRHMYECDQCGREQLLHSIIRVARLFSVQTYQIGKKRTK